MSINQIEEFMPYSLVKTVYQIKNFNFSILLYVLSKYLNINCILKSENLLVDIDF